MTQVKLANNSGCTYKIIWNTLKRYYKDEKLETRRKISRSPTILLLYFFIGTPVSILYL
jgi:hypothetical protein